MVTLQSHRFRLSWRAIVATGGAACSNAALAQACQPSWATGFGIHGVNGSVTAITLWDDGSGPALFVGGRFNAAGNSPNAKGLAKWDGQRWLALDRGIVWDTGEDALQWVDRFVVFDDGAGPALYLCGKFRYCGGQPTPSIAKWDGERLHPLPNTLDPGSNPLPLHDMTVFDDGSGPALYVAGEFRGVSGVFTPGIAKWNGVAWSPAGAGISVPPHSPFDTLGADSIDVFDDGQGNALYATVFAPGVGRRVMRFRAGQWDEVVGYVQVTGTRLIRAVNGGPAAGLYLWGSQRGVNSLQRFDGVEWSLIPAGASDYAPRFVQVATTIPPLLAVGRAIDAPGYPTRVQLWNGASWTNLGEPIAADEALLGVITPHAPDGPLALVVHKAHPLGARVVVREEEASTPLVEPGLGSPFVIRGLARSAAGPTHETFALRADVNDFFNVARQSEDGWSIDPAFQPPDGYAPGQRGRSLVPIATPEGTAVAAIGSFRFPFPGGAQTNFAAALWDGFTWSPTGRLQDTHPEQSAWSATAFDAGAGPELIVAGEFTSLDGIPALNIARWTGTAWNALDAGLNARVYAVATHDDGDGRALYAGGAFTRAGPEAAYGLARWDGHAWAPIPGFQGIVTALTGAREQGDDVLYVAGFNLRVSGQYFGRLATYRNGQWTRTPLSVYAYPAPERIWAHGEGTTQFVFVSGPAAIYLGPFNLGPLAIFDGVRWSGLGADIDGTVTSILVDDSDPSGRVSLTLGGDFTRVGEIASTNIARIDLCSLACPADTNADRVINMADLNNMLEQYAQPSPGYILPADLNADGSVNFLDLNILLSNFGEAC